jgi:hypothetical protein
MELLNEIISARAGSVSRLLLGCARGIPSVRIFLARSQRCGVGLKMETNLKRFVSLFRESAYECERLP